MGKATTLTGLNRTQFSTATLLVVTFLCAVLLALPRFDLLLIPTAFPFTVGPIIAFYVTPTKSSLVMGVLFAIFGSLAAVAPVGVLVWLEIRPIAAIAARLLGPSLFLDVASVFLFAASMLGGYVGGVAARPD